MAGQRLLGVWDNVAAALSFGGAIILAADVLMRAHETGAEPVGLLVVGEGDRDEAADAAIAAWDALDGVGEARVVADLEEALAETRGVETWPPLSSEGVSGYVYGRTAGAQGFYARHGFVPALTCRLEHRSWADDLLGGGPVVACHLKDDGLGPARSNADHDAWFAFFERAGERARFVLVGLETPDERIAALPNVVVAREEGSGPGRDLALVERAAAFMGMASGPCNMAIFGTRPYAMYKNSDHHAEEMAEELGDADRYPFAHPGQYVLRVDETAEELTGRLDELLSVRASA
ncbi:MAG: hypothetical protein ACYDHH_34245 [Solirubrobacteraceae bacterium]